MQGENLDDRQSGLPYDLFVVHADDSRAWVSGFMLDALRIAPARVVSLQQFRPGASLVSEFERAVISSRFTAIVFTPELLANQWAEFAASLATFVSIDNQGDRVIPIILRPCAIPLSVAFRVQLDCTSEPLWDDELARLRSLIKQPEPGEQPAPRCPYPGMRPYTADEANLFFGRDADVDVLVDKVLHQRLVFVIGPSGSGKSSLIAAGLLRHLMDGRIGEWMACRTRPGVDPLAALRDCLNGGVSDTGSDISHDWAELVQGVLQEHTPSAKLLIVVDQLEEMFAREVPQISQNAFCEAVASLAGNPRCHVVVALRSDFYSDLQSSGFWPVEARQRVEIGPLRGAALRSAIVAPAEAMGVVIEPLLTERLVTDASDARGPLPLLQEVMRRLWRGLRRRYLSVEAYEKLAPPGGNGIVAAIAAHADSVLDDQLDGIEARKIARRVFIRLVSFGEGRPDTRRQQSVSALRSDSEDVETFNRTLDTLIEYRLLTSSGTLGSADVQIDIAHDSLITDWPTLRSWVNRLRYAELTRRRLEDRASEWVRLREASAGAGLLDAVELAEAEAWLAGEDAELIGSQPENVKALVSASRMAISAAQRDRRRQRRRLLIASAITMVLLAVLAGVATWQREIAVRQSRTSSMRALWGQTFGELNQHLDISLLLAAQVQTLTDESPASESWRARSALIQALTYSPHLGGMQDLSRACSWVVDISDDGRYLACSGDGAEPGVVVWDIQNHRQSGTARSLKGIGSPHSLRLSRDGRLLALYIFDPQRNFAILFVIDLSTDLIQVLSLSTLDKLDVFAMEFSPDNLYLAVGADDGTVTLWNVRTGKAVGEPLHCTSSGRDTNIIYSLAFSSNGLILVTGNEGGFIEIWDTASQTRVGDPLQTDRAPVLSLAIRPDGAVLASGDWSGALIFWDMNTRSQIGEKITSEDDDTAFSSTAFSADGRFLLSSGTENRVTVWDVEKRKHRVAFRGHSRPIMDMAFTPVGDEVVSIDNHGQLMTWQMDERLGIGEIFRAPSGGPIAGAALSGDGTTLAILEHNGHVSLMDTVRHQLVGVIPDGCMKSDMGSAPIAFSRNGSKLACAGSEGMLTVWDVSRKPYLATTYESPDENLGQVGFSDDESLLVASSWSERLIVWPLVNGVSIDRPYVVSGVRVPVFEFASDGRSLLFPGPDGEVFQWRSSSPQSKAALVVNPDGFVNGVSVSRGDGMMATLDGDTIRFWNSITGEAEGPSIGGFSNTVHEMRYSPDGSLVAVALPDQSIGFWNAHNRVLLATTPPRTGGFPQPAFMEFSRDGTLLLTEEAENAVVLWDLDGTRLRERACQKANRNLTLSEWRQYVGDSAYECTCPGAPAGESAPPLARGCSAARQAVLDIPGKETDRTPQGK